MSIILRVVVILALGYVLGSIPFGLIVARLRGGLDITKQGSGNIGVTNVMRTLGKRAAALAAIGDLGKGYLAVFLSARIAGDLVVPLGPFEFSWQVAQFLGALACMAGHNWSCFLRFHGGRGVAVFFGSWLAVSPLVALWGGEILFFVVLRTRYMSLASICGSLAIWTLLAILTLTYNFPPVYLLYGLLATVLIIYQHRDNIARLLAGTERRMGFTADRRSA